MKISDKVIKKGLLIFTASIFLIGCTTNNASNVNTYSSDEVDVDDIETEESLTRYIYEEPSLETNEVYNETYANVITEYTETVAYINRFPDIELPEIEGFKKDAYGNYVITEQMFADKMLPINNDGVIEYISYYDENGIMVNPMPSYYNNYLQYFANYGG